jgi:hypothetical protein
MTATPSIDLNQDFTEFRKDIVGTLAMYGDRQAGLHKSPHGFCFHLAKEIVPLKSFRTPELFLQQQAGKEAKLSSWLSCILSSSVNNQGELTAPALLASSFDPFQL